MDSGGIQVGTCIATLLKRKAPKSAPDATVIHYRDFWGRGDATRRALLESLGMAGWTSARKTKAAETPEGPRAYEEFTAEESTWWRLMPQDSNAGYEAWPGIDEIFEVSFQGVNPNRGIEGSLIVVSRELLEQRMARYFGAAEFAEVEAMAPELAKNRAGYDAVATREDLRRNSAFAPELIVPYLLFPLDLRWIYYEPASNLLNRRRPEFWENLPGNEFLVAVPHARRPSEGRPLLARALADLHVHDRGAVFFPRSVRSGELISGPLANFAVPAWRTLRDHFGMGGDRDSDAAKKLVGDLFRAVLAIGHSPRFEEDHRSALEHDWLHVPIPKSLTQLERLVALGDQVAKLLDPQADAADAIRAILGAERSARVGVIRSGAGGRLDLHVRISYFGAARGRWSEREYTEEEEPADGWGARTGDLFLND